MKNAIAIFVERHPVMTFMLVSSAIVAVRDAAVGISRAITGNYPPEPPKAEAANLPKVDISIHKPETEKEPDGVCEEVSGEVADILN